MVKQLDGEKIMLRRNFIGWLSALPVVGWFKGKEKDFKTAERIPRDYDGDGKLKYKPNTRYWQRIEIGKYKSKQFTQSKSDPHTWEIERTFKLVDVKFEDLKVGQMAFVFDTNRLGAVYRFVAFRIADPDKVGSLTEFTKLTALQKVGGGWVARNWRPDDVQQYVYEIMGGWIYINDENQK